MGYDWVEVDTDLTGPVTERIEKHGREERKNNC